MHAFSEMRILFAAVADGATAAIAACLRAAYVWESGVVSGGGGGIDLRGRRLRE